MPLYTVLKKKDIDVIMKDYDDDLVMTYQPFKGGSSNSNYYVATTENEYVLTVSDNKSTEESLALAQLLEHLKAHRFDTTIVLKNKEDKYVSQYQGKPILLKSYIPGEVREDMDLKTLEKLGRSLGQLNKIPPLPFLPQQFPYGQQCFHEVLDMDHPFIPWLKERHTYILSHMDAELPHCLIHGDVFDNNVVVRPDGIPIIMDFEEACYYYRVFEMGMAIIGLCVTNQKVIIPKVHALLKGYRKQIEMTPLEMKSIKAFTVYAATATAFWRFRQFNIIEPLESLKESYKEMKNIADGALSIADDEYMQNS